MNLRSNDNQIIQQYYLQKEKRLPLYRLNYFLKYMANDVLQNIISDIKAAGIFSIIVDETQDLGRHEQVSIVIHYDDKDPSPHESFIGFY